MRLEREWVEKLIYGSEPARRFTQDSPILPDVWIGYGLDPTEPMDLLLTPYGDARAGDLARGLHRRLKACSKPKRSGLCSKAEGVEIAYNRSTVAAKLSFDVICALALPISYWWYRCITKPNEGLSREDGQGEDVREEDSEKPIDPAAVLTQLSKLGNETLIELIRRPLSRPDIKLDRRPAVQEIVWMALTVGALMRGLGTELSEDEEASVERRHKAWLYILETPAESLDTMAQWFRRIAKTFSESEGLLLYSVNRNRPFQLSIWRSCQTVKADAANRVFATCCGELTWAIVDSGIDAEHMAFRLRNEKENGKPYDHPFEQLGEPGASQPRWLNRTRIKATYDFSCIRSLLAGTQLPESLQQRVDADDGLKKQLVSLRRYLQSGCEVDWSLLEPFIQVPHTDDGYVRPGLEHGTHVAGTLGADWDGQTRDGLPYQGMCPDINLLDIRVMDAEGAGNEFTVIAALQYLRWLNAHKDFQVVHGVNLSLSIPHDVANYACGRTPICEECERLVNSGIVVVAAAGNKGYLKYMTSEGLEDGYLSISITDPGNAQGVITVGSTHRSAPHSYGVSYFSSRGPTGDGRCKPDLIAPGEKIEAPVPENGSKVLDGTSMAAPHVSGAAALLMARNRELRGDPVRIKDILCSTATDLGRERYFQGCGLVDVLRALQSV